MAVFYNSSAQIQSANFTNVSAASLVTGTIQSAQTAAINVTVSTGANSTGALMSNLVFSNLGQNITFGLATAAGGGTITASAAGAGAGGSINFSAGTTSNNLATVVFSNSNNVSFGLNGSTITATAVASVNFSGGTTSNNLSNIVFSNSGNVSFGLNGSTMTATIPVRIMSHYDNMPLINALATTTLSSNATNVLFQPFQLPSPISIGWVRLLMSFPNPPGPNFGSSLGQFQYGATSSWWINIYTIGTGASSASLVSLATTSGTNIYQATANGINGSNSLRHTVSWDYYVKGVAANSSWSTQIASANFNFSNNTSAFTNFSGLRFLDIPFATSLEAGNYFFGINNSINTSTNTANMTGLSISNSNLVVLQVSSQFREMGNTTQRGIVVGLGTINLTTIGASASINNISANASQPKLPFQLVRHG